MTTWLVYDFKGYPQNYPLQVACRSARYPPQRLAGLRCLGSGKVPPIRGKMVHIPRKSERKTAVKPMFPGEVYQKRGKTVHCPVNDKPCRAPHPSGSLISLRNPEPSAIRCFCEEIDNQLITEISEWLRVSFFLPLSMSVF